MFALNFIKFINPLFELSLYGSLCNSYGSLCNSYGSLCKFHGTDQSTTVPIFSSGFLSLLYCSWIATGGIKFHFCSRYNASHPLACSSISQAISCALGVSSTTFQ